MANSTRELHLAPREESQAFQERLFGACPKDHYVLFWSAPRKHSMFVRVGDLDHNADELNRLCSQGEDVYVGVGLASRDYGEMRRCPASEIAGLVAWWADIDVKHPVHKKHNLPPTQADALSLLDDLGMKPSVVVDSGHGLQLWWLFREPWIFKNDADRAKAAALARQWGETIRVKAAARGWQVDSVSDLSRLMRLPGSLNWKEARTK